MRQVGSVQFFENGSVLVVYMDPATDVRNRGLLVKSHTIQIEPGEAGKDYLDEIEDVRDAVTRLLNDALEDFETTDPVEESNARAE